MNYKLKHLVKFCCKPANELEFEAVKMAAELGGIDKTVHFDFCELNNKTIHLSRIIRFDLLEDSFKPHEGETEIPVIDFIRKLRMTEEEAMELEDDRVLFVGVVKQQHWMWSNDGYSIVSLNDHHFRVSEDGKTVTLHKEKQ